MLQIIGDCGRAFASGHLTEEYRDWLIARMKYLAMAMLGEQALCASALRSCLGTKQAACGMQFALLCVTGNAFGDEEMICLRVLQLANLMLNRTHRLRLLHTIEGRDQLILRVLKYVFGTGLVKSAKGASSNDLERKAY